VSHRRSAASQAEPIVERARADAHRDGEAVGRDPGAEKVAVGRRLAYADNRWRTTGR
jgi:hypothetical protein